MKLRKTIGIALILTTALLALFIFSKCRGGNEFVVTPVDSSERGEIPSHVKVSNSNQLQAFTAMFQTPITIYGQVNDQHGKPVVGATVVLTPVDNPFVDKSTSKIKVLSDDKGQFSATGLKGSSLGVSASKNGYLYLSPVGGPSSAAMVDYAGEASSGKRYSNSHTPLILTLHDLGKIHDLIHNKEVRWKLSYDGTPRRIALDSPDGQGSHWIEFRLWSDGKIRDTPGVDFYSPFDWRFEARIPGGGFIWNDSDFNFEAPADGYKEMIRYDRPKTLSAERWQRFENGRYFIKFSDGTFGRLLIDIDGGSTDAPLSMASWLSRTPGNRNIASPNGVASGFHGVNPENK